MRPLWDARDAPSRIVARKRIVKRSQRQGFDERLHNRRKTLVGEKYAGEDPHRHHHEIDQPADALDFLRPAGGQQANATERNCAQRSDQQNAQTDPNTRM